MKKIALGLVSILTVFASGCATVPAPQPMAGDKEPILVGKPVAERVAESTSSIDDQLTLLQKVQSGGKVGTYSVVTHNNNLDARLGSPNTVPKAYAAGKTQGTTISEQKIHKIEWKNNSLNQLAKDLAHAMGYQVVIKEGKVADKNIDFTVHDEGVSEVVDKLTAQVAPFAQVVVIEQNKTFNIFYQ